ncbi:MAG: AP2 domain-containing protein [Chloroflexota bacterium]|nr:AP2 domain-containing protein [Chloroflexota bacterium]
MRKRTVKHKNLTRVDHDASRMHGYNVRIMWQAQRRAKFFSDTKYGDRLGALTAALAWHDATEKALGKPRTERQVVGIFYSTSAEPGIRRVRENHTEYYQATWATSAGKQQRTRYSITKHGEKRALQLARKARARGERERWRTPAHVENES